MAEAVMGRDRTKFRYESDLVSVVRDALPRLAFRHDKTATVEVFSEVPAVHGVPDLVGIRFDAARLHLREQGGVRPLSTDAEVRVVMAVGERRTIRELGDRAGLSNDYVRRNMIPLLNELGWIESDGAGAIRRRPEAQWVAGRVVTIEAKLRDWRKALAQARRQRLSGDAAYIAMDALAMQGLTPYLTKLAEEGIGAIAVDAESKRAVVLSRPARIVGTHREVGRNLLSERCLGMLEQGTREGQIYPVFGWTLPPAT